MPCLMIHAMMSCTVLKFSTVATDGLKEIEEEDRSKCRRIANTQYNDLWYGANHLEAAYFLLFRFKSFVLTPPQDSFLALG
jgi:hypothetical protein